MFCKPENCEFHVIKTEFLGYVISASGVSMDPKKPSAVLAWNTAASVKNVQTFLCFDNFYCQLIRNYSQIVSLMTNLLKRDQKSEWNPSANHFFVALKNAFTTALSLPL